MHAERLVDKVFSLLKITASNLEEHGLEVGLPLSFSDALGVLHHLAGTVCLPSHLKVLCILKHCR